jgi:hypothetical protein
MNFIGRKWMVLYLRLILKRLKSQMGLSLASFTHEGIPTRMVQLDRQICARRECGN